MGILVRSPKGFVSNFFIASKAKHPFWSFAISRMVKARPPNAKCKGGDCVMFAAGPKFLDATWNAFIKETSLKKDAYKVYDFTEWQESLAMHHWAGTWHCSGNSTSCSQQETIAAKETQGAHLGVDASQNCIMRPVFETLNRR